MVTLTQPASETVLACRYCGHSEALIRHGRNRGGNPRLRCRACNKTFCLNPGTTAHSEEFKQQVLAACHERSSMRGVCRIFKISRNTLAAWLEKKSD
jgi:transposase